MSATAKKSNSYGPIGFIHHGADDNASGVSGLLCHCRSPQQIAGASAAIADVGALGWRRSRACLVRAIGSPSDLAARPCADRGEHGHDRPVAERAAGNLWHADRARPAPADERRNRRAEPAAGFSLGDQARQRSFSVYRSWYSGACCSAPGYMPTTIARATRPTRSTRPACARSRDGAADASGTCRCRHVADFAPSGRMRASPRKPRSKNRPRRRRRDWALS